MTLIDPTPAKFGRLLRDYRRRLRLSKQDVAELAGVSREMISHLETGMIGVPDWALLRQFVHGLRIPPLTILESLGLMLTTEEWLTPRPRPTTNSKCKHGKYGKKKKHADR